MNQPDFIIIGAMKCATSTLYQQLMKQPGIFLSPLKEPNFFSNDEIYFRGMDWYQALFAAAGKNDILGEASTHYTKLPTYPDTVNRIHQHLPDAKFIYVMRHPVDRLVSQYIHEWTQNVICCDINQALKSHKELVDYSRYYYQIRPYLEVFGRDRVLPVFFEQMLANPELGLQTICRFIGYNGTPEWFDLDVQNASSERIRRFPGYEVFVENPFLQWLRRTLIPKSLRNNVKSYFSMHHRPELSAECLVRLERVFDEDLAMMGEELGVPLCCDTYKDTVTSNVLAWKK